ncbi:MAG: hypothetical protein OXG96_11450, partial [Acidobacteria bacterium]|nr:hypothetical protein [Acidobacteriota bacterium]
MFHPFLEVCSANGRRSCQSLFHTGSGNLQDSRNIGLRGLPEPQNFLIAGSFPLFEQLPVDEPCRWIKPQQSHDCLLEDDNEVVPALHVKQLVQKLTLKFQKRLRSSSTV